ncbi:MAG: glycosyltransferase family 2 protein [Pseudomonadota bacterium]
MKVSVITAVRNNRDTIAAALNSVLAQTYADVELVVIDGASTDGTLAVLESYRDKLAVLVSERDAGIYDALNKGIARATGDVIGFLHADDLLADTTVLARIAEVMASGVEGVYGDLLYVRKQDPSQTVRYWRSRPYTPDLLARGWMPAHPTLYLKRAVYQRHGNFNTSYRIAADYDFMLRILAAGISVSYIPQVLVKMRIGGASNRSLRNLIRKSAEDWRALRQNGVGGAWTLLCKNLSKLPQFFSKSA